MIPQVPAIRGLRRISSAEFKSRDDGEIRCSIRRMMGRYKAIRLFLVGVLCGVIITAAVAFGLTIPANSDYWRMEIWKRGGGVWTFDKNGNLSWAWTVKPIPDTASKKQIVIPSSQTNVRSEHL
jgi:hypothetical protein